jgi:hypothetical protein
MDGLVRTRFAEGEANTSHPSYVNRRPTLTTYRRRTLIRGSASEAA